MKKQLFLLLCCTSLVISGIAQPESSKIHSKFFKKDHLEKLYRKNHFKKENLNFSQKQTFPFQKPYQSKSSKNVEWWEPDTIYVYYLNDADERHIFSYENGKCTVELTQQKLNNQWINVSRGLYSYDVQNNRIEELWELWESGIWKNDFRTVSTYDLQNNETSHSGQLWESGLWVNVFIYTYKYDSQNNMIEETDQFWEGGQWINVIKYIYSYNTYNNWTEILFQSWEDERWITFGVETFTYNAQNDWSEILIQIYENDQWINDMLQTFTYNEQNQCTSYILQSWELDFGQWKNQDKVSLTYDAQNNRTSELWQYWYFGKWVNSNKTTCSYDENNNATSGYSHVWNGNTWVYEDGLCPVFYNNMQSSIDIGGYKFTATYIKPDEVGITEYKLLNNSVKVYPNPVSNMLYIETENDIIPQIKIYSIRGILLVNAKGKEIDISSLPIGVYIVDIDGVYQKIVKQ
jgi:hypothetical protein